MRNDGLTVTMRIVSVLVLFSFFVIDGEWYWLATGLFYGHDFAVGVYEAP